MTVAPLWIDDPAAARGAAAAIIWTILPHDPRLAAWQAAAPVDRDDLTDFAGRRDAGERIVRRRLARLLVATVAGVHPGTVRLRRDPGGRPLVDGPEGLHIGLSGHGGAIAIGLARMGIGVDIEAVDTAPPDLAMLTPPERALLAAATPDDRARVWTRLWAGKEAHAKRTGDPRRLAPQAIATTPTAAHDDHGGASTLHHRDLPGHAACAALTRP